MKVSFQPYVLAVTAFAVRSKGLANRFLRAGATRATFFSSQPASNRPSTRVFSFAKEKHEENTVSMEEVASTSMAPFATNYHAPVMHRECIEALLGCGRAQEGGERGPLFFVDGTLGGGGHSQALLEQLEAGDVVFGCDVDPAALSTASTRLSDYMQGNLKKPWFIPIKSNFADITPSKLQLPGAHPSNHSPVETVDGILMDLGVSSHQIDTAERGFAFMKDGPLDMRMSQNIGLTASDLLNEMDQRDLQRILRVYGDEPRAKKLSMAIMEQRPLQTTQDLVQAVARVIPEFARKGRRMGRTATLARVFQSLRIVVNQEDAVLTKALTEMAPMMLRPGGRLVVMSYHSMEDRATKRVMRDGAVKRELILDERDLYGNLTTQRPFRTIGKRVKAADEEVALNPRSRSATLRVAERQ